MPLYEYECDACGRRFERIQKFSDPPVAACPTCNGPVRKLLSSPAIQFKGSGFYITDYVKSGGGAAEPAAPKAATDTASSTDSTKAASPTSSTASPANPAKSEPAKAPTGPSGKD